MTTAVDTRADDAIVEEMIGPFCNVHGCIDIAEGALIVAYAERYLICEAHLRPVRSMLVSADRAARDRLARAAH